MTGYNSFYTLDMENQTLTPIEPNLRNIEPTVLRIILTLVLEGAAFYLFGFRKKRSWFLFVLINMLTQIGLNFWLGAVYHTSFGGFSPYFLTPIIAGEILVMIVELILFGILIKEHSRRRTIWYVVTANLFSLIAGFFIIVNLHI